MRIIGIDTSLRSTGYGIIDIKNNKASAIDCGVIKNKTSLSQLQCLYRISAAIEQLIDLYKPDEVSIEGAFFHKNAKTAMILGMARGAALAPTGKHQLPVYEYSPKTAKLSVTGSGSAGKEQVAYMMAQILKIDKAAINDDATDALALCYCHYNHRRSGSAEANKLN